MPFVLLNIMKLMCTVCVIYCSGWKEIHSNFYSLKAVESPKEQDCANGEKHAFKLCIIK